MALKPQPAQLNVFYGRVIATYPDARVIDVKWPNVNVIKRSVIVVQDSSNYSFPLVGEIGLVIGNDVERYYYLGKIEFGYSQQLEAQSNGPAAGNSWALSLIEAGEVQLLNLLTGAALYLSNSGDFSLKNQLMDGLSYIREKTGNPFRWLTLAAKTVTLTSSTTSLTVGAVIRNIPVLGNTIIKGVTDKTKAAQEFLAKVTNIVGPAQINRAKLHLGDILIEPVASSLGAIPVLHTEAGVAGAAAALQALLAVFNPVGIETASVKMDNLGNLSVNANLPGTGMLVINGVQIYIGCTPLDMSQPMVKGTDLLTWLNTHTHNSSIGPTGTPVVIATPLDFCSTKTFVS